jgi:hypothetical protein
MVRGLREWWSGKDVRVDPTAADTTGGMGNLHECRNEKHWTSRAAHRFVDWHARNWVSFWTLVIAAIGVLVAYLALK